MLGADADVSDCQKVQLEIFGKGALFTLCSSTEIRNTGKIRSFATKNGLKRHFCSLFFILVQNVQDGYAVLKFQNVRIFLKKYFANLRIADFWMLRF